MEARFVRAMGGMAAWAIVSVGLPAHATGQGKGAGNVGADEGYSGLFRVDVAGSQEGLTLDGITQWTIEIQPPLPDFVEVEARVSLVSRVAACAESPDACGAQENFLAIDEQTGGRRFGCLDAQDNDADGLVDAADPDCQGAIGWTLAVRTDSTFNLEQASSDNTVGALRDTPPGRREFAGLEATEVIDPASNDGLEGAVSIVQLSIVGPVLLDPVGEDPVLLLRGRISTADLDGPGDRTPPTEVHVLPPNGTALIAPSGIERQTRVFLSGADGCCVDSLPGTRNASIQLIVAGGEDQPLLARCDANGDGRQDIGDSIRILTALFLIDDQLPCADAGDCNDDSSVDVTDGIFAISYRFSGGPPPPAPFPDCGVDATEDSLDCREPSDRCAR